MKICQRIQRKREHQRQRWAEMAEMMDRWIVWRTVKWLDTGDAGPFANELLLTEAHSAEVTNPAH